MPKTERLNYGSVLPQNESYDGLDGLLIDWLGFESTRLPKKSEVKLSWLKVGFLGEFAYNSLATAEVASKAMVKDYFIYSFYFVRSIIQDDEKPI